MIEGLSDDEKAMITDEVIPAMRSARLGLTEWVLAGMTADQEALRAAQERRRTIRRRVKITAVAVIVVSLAMAFLLSL